MKATTRIIFAAVNNVRKVYAGSGKELSTQVSEGFWNVVVGGVLRVPGWRSVLIRTAAGNVVFVQVCCCAAPPPADAPAAVVSCWKIIFVLPC